MMLPPIFLEAINGILTILFLWLLVWFAYDIYTVYNWTSSWRSFYREAAVSIACAIAFFGDFIIRGSVWIYRHIENDGGSTKDIMQLTTLSISVGVVIMIFGCACIIQRIAPPSLGRLPWAIAVLTSIAIGVWSSL